MPPIEKIIITPENVKDLTDDEIFIIQAEAERRITENLNNSEEMCSFPQHEGYAKLWEKLKNNPAQQEYLKENIRISADGKIEIIKMKKKFSILQAEHNGKDIFKGEYEDQYGKKGVAGVTYLTGRAAENECDKQKKNLLKDQTEVKQFISYFPGKNNKERIFNFVHLFNLEKSGFWSSIIKEWSAVGYVGYAGLSEENSRSIYGVIWDSTSSYIDQTDSAYPSPFVAYEPA